MSRSRIEEFNSRFVRLHLERCRVANTSNPIELYAPDRPIGALRSTSAATWLVRSAAVVEQMINGLTVRLWDDPFEWTLPERLATPEDLMSYFDEVEAARIRGFQFFRDDSDLQRSIPAPVELETLDVVLTDAVSRSEGFLAEATGALSRRLTSPR